MKSLERRFNKLAKTRPYLGSTMIFYQSIKGQDFSRQTLHRWFNKLVDKQDYQRSDKKAILAEVEKLNIASRQPKSGTNSLSSQRLSLELIS